MNKIWGIIIFLLFGTNAFFYVFLKQSPGLGGDEVSSYITLMPFFHGLEKGILIPTILVYYHEPIQQLAQLPVLLLGATNFFVRLPNIVSGILTFMVLYKIGLKIFKNQKIYILGLLSLYVFSGFTLILRTGIDAGLFNLTISLMILKLIDYEQSNKPLNFKKALIIFLVSLFVFIDGIFLLPGVYLGKKLKEKIELTKQSWKIVLIAGLLFIVWSAAVFSGSIFSGVYDWRLQAPFKLFGRGMAFFPLSFKENFTLINNYNSAWFTIFVIISLVFSVFDKRSRFFWRLLIIPLAYFNFVKMPTLHVVNFWVLIIICVMLGVRFAVNRTKFGKYLFFTAFTLVLLVNIGRMRFANPFEIDRQYKIAATFVRKQTRACEKIYTNVEGTLFRFYFDRGYTLNINDKPEFAVIEGISGNLLPGYTKIAEVEASEGKNIFIYKKDFTGKTTIVNTIDVNLFTHANTVTYVTDCRK